MSLTLETQRVYGPDLQPVLEPTEGGQAFAGITDFGLTEGDHVATVVAHPDDDSIMMDEFVRQAVEAGVIVSAIVASNGEQGRGDRAALHDGLRRDEQQAYYADRGISRERQHFLGRPDAWLHTSRQQRRVAKQVSHILGQNDFAAVMTLGEEGGDRHGDHIGVHHAVMGAVRQQYHRTGRTPAVYGVNARGQGRLVLRVDRDAKQAGAHYHGSQYDPDDIDAYWLPDSRLYDHGHFFSDETYDLLLHRQIGGQALRPAAGLSYTIRRYGRLS